MRRAYQVRILDLLILTTLIAFVIQLWPRTTVGMRTQLALIGWTALCCLQLVLLRKSWLAAPNERDKGRYVAYVIAYPACLSPILVWLFVMIAIVLESMKATVLSDLMILPLFLMAAWGYSLIAIPISFFAGRAANDRTFLWLRVVAMINLLAPMYPLAM